MKLPSNHTIAGIDVRALRDFFKKRQDLGFDQAQLADCCSLSPAVAARSVKELLTIGLISEPEGGGPKAAPCYHLTTAGGQLAQLKFTPRFSRAAGRALLAQVVANAERINADNDLTHRITELRVFGSYLTDAADLGDLDIAFALSVRYPDRDLVAMSLGRAQQWGRSGLSFVERLGFGELEVMKLMKGGKHRVSLHTFEELAQLGVEGVQVFPQVA